MEDFFYQDELGRMQMTYAMSYLNFKNIDITKWKSFWVEIITINYDWYHRSTLPTIFSLQLVVHTHLYNMTKKIISQVHQWPT